MRKVQLKINKDDNTEDLTITQKVSYKKPRIKCIINVTQIVDSKDKRIKERDKNKEKHKRLKDKKLRKHTHVKPQKKDVTTHKKTNTTKNNSTSEKEKSLEDEMCNEDRIIPRCFRCKCYKISMNKKRCRKLENKLKKLKRQTNINKTQTSVSDNKLCKMLNEYRETERNRKEHQSVLRLYEDQKPMYTKYKKKLRDLSIGKFPYHSDTESMNTSDLGSMDLPDISLESITEDEDAFSSDMDISIHSDQTLILEPDIHTCSTPKLDELYSPISSAEGSPYSKLHNMANGRFYKTNWEENTRNTPDIKNLNGFPYSKVGGNVVTTFFDEAYSPISSCDELSYSANSNYFKSIKTEPISPRDNKISYFPTYGNFAQDPTLKLGYEFRQITGCAKNDNDLVIKKESLADSDEVKIKKENFGADSNNNEDFVDLSERIYTNYTRELNASLFSANYSPIKSRDDPNTYNFDDKYCLKKELENYKVKAETLSPVFDETDSPNTVDFSNAAASSNGIEQINIFPSVTKESE